MCPATCLASTKASSFVLQENSTLWLINKVLSKVGLNKKLYYNQNIPLDFQVHQNLGWWAVELPLHSSSDFPTSQCEITATDSAFLGWGATTGHAIIAGLWEWERLWSHINKKELQICFITLEYFVPHLRDIYVQLSVYNTAAVSYLNHARSQALSDLAIAIWEWYLLFSNSHTRYCKQNRIWSVSSEARKHRMDVRFQCFR